MEQKELHRLLKNTAKCKQFKELSFFGQNYMHSVFWYCGTTVTGQHFYLAKLLLEIAQVGKIQKPGNSCFSRCLPLQKGPVVFLTNSTHSCFYVLVPAVFPTLEHQVFIFHPFLKTSLIIQ